MRGIVFAVAVRSVQEATHNLTIKEGHTIACDFIGYPLLSLTWTFDGRLADPVVFSTSQEQIMRDDGEVVTRSYLHFTPHSTLFAGDYVCTAEQTLNQAHCTVHVNIQGILANNKARLYHLDYDLVPAEILVAPPSSNQDIGSSVILSCVGYGIPAPKVTWKHLGSELPQQLVTQHPTEMLRGVYVIRSFVELCPLNGLVGNGQYSCEVDNAVSSAQGNSIKSAFFDVCFRSK